MSQALNKIDSLLNDLGESDDKYVYFYDGTKVPVVALGTWKSEPGVVGKAVSAAIDLGYRHIDCAKIYENEKEVGASIAEAIKSGTVKREDLFIVSKLWNSHHDPKIVVEQCKSTIEDLQCGTLDCYLIHWPVCFSNPLKTVPAKGDPYVSEDHPCDEVFETGDTIYSVAETYKAMEECVRLGLVKHIGLSNFNLKQLAEILAVATIPPAMLQNEAHLYCQAEKMVQFCKKNDIVFTGYSPLGSGDRPWAKKDEPTVLHNPVAEKIGAKYGKSVAQVVLRFQVQRGIVVPPKSTKVERLKQNLDLFSFKLTDDEMEQLRKEDKNWASCVPPFSPRLHPYWPFNKDCGALWD